MRGPSRPGCVHSSSSAYWDRRCGYSCWIHPESWAPESASCCNYCAQRTLTLQIGFLRYLKYWKTWITQQHVCSLWAYFRISSVHSVEYCVVVDAALKKRMLWHIYLVYTCWIKSSSIHYLLKLHASVVQVCFCNSLMWITAVLKSWSKVCKTYKNVHTQIISCHVFINHCYFHYWRTEHEYIDCMIVSN